MPVKRRAGHHCSISHSLESAALHARAIGANTLQIFSASPRMWKAGRPSDVAVLALRRAREKHDLWPLVIHDNYLINLASCNDGLRAKSIACFRGEIERALLIGAEYLVAHPGNCKGHTVEMGIHTFCQALGEAAQGIDARGLTLLLENTAGSGDSLGSRFEELAVLRQHAANFTDMAVGFCIDTCHTLAAGYDLAGKTSETVALIDAILGLENVHVIHANDSKAPLGSHVDRHEHIGRGHIGEAGFRAILSHPRLRAKPFIAETPVDEEGDDARNVARLFALGESRTSRNKASEK